MKRIALRGSYGTDYVSGVNAPGYPKRLFANDGRRYLREVHRLLGPEFKPVGKRAAVSFNPAGPAVSGEATLHVAGPDGIRVFVEVSAAGIFIPDGTLSPSRVSIMWRVGRRDYAVDGRNIWTKWDLPAADLAGDIRRTLDVREGAG